MAAKKKEPVASEEKVRKIALDADYFRKEASELRALGEVMRKIAEQMEEKKLATIGVLGKSMYEDYGKKYVKRFILSAQRELT